jgi:hypothetical protein
MYIHTYFYKVNRSYPLIIEVRTPCFEFNGCKHGALFLNKLILQLLSVRWTDQSSDNINVLKMHTYGPNHNYLLDIRN